MKQGPLKLKRKRIKYKNYIGRLVGVIIFAAILIIPTYVCCTFKEDFEVEEVVTTGKLTAGVASDLFNLDNFGVLSNRAVAKAGVAKVINPYAAKHAEAFTEDNDIEDVKSSNPEVYEIFKTDVSNLYSWCLSKQYLDLTLCTDIHCYEYDCNTLNISSITDNISKDSHVKVTKPNYSLDMWYNVAKNDYTVNLSNNEEDSDWVSIPESLNGVVQNFFHNQIVYNTTVETTSEVLKTIITSENYDISFLDYDSYIVTYCSENPLDCSPAVDSDTVDSCCVTVVKTADNLTVAIHYDFVESQFLSEDITFNIKISDMYSLAKPVAVNEHAGSVTDLQSVYNKIF